jgi:transposase
MAWRSGQSYSADLRERVLALVDGGLPATTAAERFGVSLSFIDKALKRRRLTGETTARAQRNQQTLKLAAHHEAIRAMVERRPDVTLEELRGWQLETHGIEASLEKKDPTGTSRGRGDPAAPAEEQGSGRHRRAA